MSQRTEKELLLLQVLSESETEGLHLLSSEPGFDLLTLIEVLQADLPQPRQVLLRTNTGNLQTACKTHLHRHNQE